ncbi:Golgi-associated plant pathogenesis-related protein 1 isoform X2 [Drosophila ficusphila]|nr:Golgi-associated plant pathogenesis-related protein 1 isoform X2 [Drosophila ficusphila]
MVVEADPKDDSLDKHNQLRKKHGSPPLTLDDELTDECEKYAKELAEKKELEHSKCDGVKYGENLCYRSHDPQKCIQNWYDEIKDYDFCNPKLDKKTAHFTALVWKEAKKMGHGQAEDEKGITYVVARYSPPVNVNGQFKENVPKPINGSGCEDNSNLPQVDAILVLLAFCLHFKI